MNKKDIENFKTENKLKNSNIIEMFIFCKQLEQIENDCKKMGIMIIDIFNYPVASFIRIYTTWKNTEDLILRNIILIDEIRTKKKGAS